MDLDEPLRQPLSGAASLAKEDLADFSVSELEERIEILKTEITRTERLIASKQTSQSAAEDVFR